MSEKIVNKKVVSVWYSSKGGVGKSTSCGAAIDFLRRKGNNKLLTVDYDASTKSLVKHFAIREKGGQIINDPLTSVLSFDVTKKQALDELFNFTDDEQTYFTFDFPGGSEKLIESLFKHKGHVLVDHWVFDKNCDVHIFIPVTAFWECLEAIVIGHNFWGDNAHYHILLNKLGDDIDLPMDTYEDIPRPSLGGLTVKEYVETKITNHTVHDLPLCPTNNLAKWSDMNMSFTDALNHNFAVKNHTSFRTADKIAIRTMLGKFDAIFSEIYGI